MSFNWNHAAETIVVAALSEVPEVGIILAPLAEIFWPEEDAKPIDYWAQVKAQVQQAINIAISDENWRLVNSVLGDAGQGTGLIGEIQLYQKALTTKDKTKI